MYKNILLTLNTNQLIMKRITQFVYAAFLLLGSITYAQTARVQIIHNSADAAAATVDIYIMDGMTEVLKLEDVTYQTATAFIDAPAGIPLTLVVAPPTSTSSAEGIYDETVTLADGSTYLVVADGLVSTTGYNPIIPFDLKVHSFASESSTAGNTAILVHHGATDAPTVDIINGDPANQSPALFNSIEYGEFKGQEGMNQSYVTLPTADYNIKVTNEATVETLSAYQADLTNIDGEGNPTSDLDGQAVVIVASGFLDPSQNSDGPAFGLFVYRSEGGGGLPIQLPLVPTTDIQLIHNSPVAGPVDIYIDGNLLYEDVEFRQASPFFEIFAGIGIKIDIRAAGSASTSTPALSSGIVSFYEATDHIGVVNGDVTNEPLSIATFDMALQNGGPTSVEVLVHHGSPDTGVVDIFETEQVMGEIAPDLAYEDFAGYLSLAPASYTLEVRPDGSSDAAGVFNVDLSGATGSALTVIASGLLGSTDPADAFALAAYGPTGGPALLFENNLLDISDFKENSIVTWPNPVGTDLNLSLSNTFQNAKVNLFDLSGRQVLSADLRTALNTIDVSRLESGIYVLELDVDSKIVSTKIFKQ